MSAQPGLTIAGDTDLAGAMARHALSGAIAESVFLWRDPADQLPARAPVIIVADPDQRSSFASIAVQAGAPAVSLPITGDDLAGPIEQGRLHQVSSLHGKPTLVRLLTDCLAGRVGRRYGIFAAHRLPRNHAGDVREALNDLLVYVASLCGGGLTSVRADSASFNGQGTDAWFTLARFADDTVATIEVASVLPEAEESTGQLLVEVTGSDAVLRAEAERQSVVINGAGGTIGLPWYEDAAGPLLTHCLSVLEEPKSVTQRAIVDLLRIVPEAAGTDQLVRP